MSATPHLRFVEYRVNANLYPRDSAAQMELYDVQRTQIWSCAGLEPYAKFLSI